MNFLDWLKEKRSSPTPSSSPTAPSTSASSSGRPTYFIHPNQLTTEASYNAIRDEMKRIQAQLMTPNQARALSAAAVRQQYTDYERFLLGLYGTAPAVASGAPKDPYEGMEPEVVRKLRLRAELRIAGGEELVSVAVRKNDGTVEARAV